MLPGLHALTEEEYQATFSPPMVDVIETTEEVVDLWGYANQIIESDYHNCPAWEWRVAYIYESRDGAYQHIGIPVPKDNTYLAVVIDKSKRCIVGHRLIDLGALCGVRSNHEP